MTTDPNHSYLANFWLTKAEAEVNPADTSPAELALIAIGHLLAAHLEQPTGPGWDVDLDDLDLGPAPELDEDNPDTLAAYDIERDGDHDTVESPHFHGLAYIDDNRLGYPPAAESADGVRLSGFAAIHRHDDFGYPWGAA